MQPGSTAIRRTAQGIAGPGSPGRQRSAGGLSPRAAEVVAVRAPLKTPRKGAYPTSGTGGGTRTPGAPCDDEYCPVVVHGGTGSADPHTMFAPLPPAGVLIFIGVVVLVGIIRVRIVRGIISRTTRT